MNKKKTLLILPIILVLIYFCADIFYHSSTIIYIKPLIIPSFIIYALVNDFDKLTKNYFLYVIFFYLNEFLLLFTGDSIQMYRFALVASFLCYLSLINLGFKSFKNRNLFTMPKGFTLFILLLNCLFLAAIVYILISSIEDNYINVILVFNAVIALVLGVTAVSYLGKFLNKKSYYYFFGAFALIFNDIFAAIVTYFIDNVLLNTIDRILHFLSFILIYLFILNDTKKVENSSFELQP